MAGRRTGLPAARPPGTSSSTVSRKGPLPPIELSQLFAKGAVGLESYVWKEGFDDWKLASDVAELAQIFGGGRSGSAQPAQSDDTSSFGTGGDLFGDGGREPTSEIDTNSSMFAGFDDAPTPTESEGAPLAAASAPDADDAAGGLMGGMGAGLGGGAAAASTPQRMTGQRNENSVLCSHSATFSSSRHARRPRLRSPPHRPRVRPAWDGRRGKRRRRPLPVRGRA